MSLMTSKVAQVLGAALLLGNFAAGCLHGEFQSTLEAIELFFLLGIGFVLIACVFAAFGSRLRRLAQVALQTSLAVLIAIPLTLGFGRVVFREDLWYLKRFVQARLVPELAAAKAAQGAYPRSLPELKSTAWWAPWLLRSCGYESTGASYTLWLMDPGVCGHTFTYTSGSRAWQERNEVCWY